MVVLYVIVMCGASKGSLAPIESLKGTKIIQKLVEKGKEKKSERDST